MRELQKFRCIGKRPENVPTHWTIWNAPRPLYGDLAWQGEFVHGIFYVAIDPDSEFAEQNTKDNISLDGWQMVYITENEAIQMVKDDYAAKYSHPIDFDKIEKNLMLETFYNNYARC